MHIIVYIANEQHLQMTIRTLRIQTNVINGIWRTSDMDPEKKNERACDTEQTQKLLSIKYCIKQPGKKVYIMNS